MHLCFHLWAFGQAWGRPKFLVPAFQNTAYLISTKVLVVTVEMVIISYCEQGNESEYLNTCLSKGNKFHSTCQNLDNDLDFTIYASLGPILKCSNIYIGRYSVNVAWRNSITSFFFPNSPEKILWVYSPTFISFLSLTIASDTG